MCLFNCRNNGDVQVFVESSNDSDFAAPASKTGRSRAHAGSDEEEADFISDASEEEDGGGGRRQALPARQLPGRTSRPVSYKDASSSGSEDEKADDFGGVPPWTDLHVAATSGDVCEHC